jgi:hypothetical protein
MGQTHFEGFPLGRTRPETMETSRGGAFEFLAFSLFVLRYQGFCPGVSSW